MTSTTSNGVSPRGPCAHGGAVHRVLQLDEDSQNAEGHAGYAGWTCGSCLVDGRNREPVRRGERPSTGPVKLRHYPPPPAISNPYFSELSSERGRPHRPRSLPVLTGVPVARGIVSWD